jgi:acyl CoA:acetate/3-ketoacid CoA transferase alpha subunit
MDKVMELHEAMAEVVDGSHLALTGFALSRNAIAAVCQLARAGVRHLTLSQVIGGMETDLLVGSGCVDHLNYSGGSLDRFGPLHSVNRAISEGSITVAEYSSLSLTLRFQAGALGLPYVAALPMLGSELLDRLDGKEGVISGSNPFTGEPVVLLAPLQPDIAIVHADVADFAGNAALDGPRWSLRETALAAEKVIVTCEELVEVGSIPPGQVVIPGEVVCAVTEARGGASPTAIYNVYDFDRTQLDAFSAAAREGGDHCREYVEKYFHPTAAQRSSVLT